MTATTSPNGTAKGTRPAGTPPTEGVESNDGVHSMDTPSARLTKLEANLAEIRQMLKDAVETLESLPAARGVQ